MWIFKWAGFLVVIFGPDFWVGFFGGDFWISGIQR